MGIAKRFLFFNLGKWFSFFLSRAFSRDLNFVHETKTEVKRSSILVAAAEFSKIAIVVAITFTAPSYNESNQKLAVSLERGTELEQAEARVHPGFGLKWWSKPEQTNKVGRVPPVKVIDAAAITAAVTVEKVRRVEK